MSWFRDKPLRFAAGEHWSYSNSGYVVLGLILERVSGLSYEQFVRDNIFTPLSMADSGYDSTATGSLHHAVGYEQTGRGPVPASFIDMSVPRNFDPRINDIDNVYLYDIDDLGGLASENLDERAREAEKAEAIVEEEIDTFWRWLASLEAVPTIEIGRAHV